MTESNLLIKNVGGRNLGATSIFEHPQNGFHRFKCAFEIAAEGAQGLPECVALIVNMGCGQWPLAQRYPSRGERSNVREHR